MRWVRTVKSGGEAPGVTAGGFCECLQGSTAMGRGIVVLTGTREIGAEEIRRLLPAVFRRVNREVLLGWMSGQDVRSYLCHFLARFVPDCMSSEWHDLEKKFTREGSPWDGNRQISVDMLKQFLMHEITEASRGWLDNFQPNRRTAPGDFQIQPLSRSAFFEQISDAEQAQRFVQKYAKVDQ